MRESQIKRAVSSAEYAGIIFIKGMRYMRKIASSTFGFDNENKFSD